MRLTRVAVFGLRWVQIHPVRHERVIPCVCFDGQVSVTRRQDRLGIVRVPGQVPIVQQRARHDPLGVAPVGPETIGFPPHPCAVPDHVAGIGHRLDVRLQVRLVRDGFLIQNDVPVTGLRGGPRSRSHGERSMNIPLTQEVLRLNIPGFVRVARREEILTEKLVQIGNLPLS